MPMPKTPAPIATWPTSVLRQLFRWNGTRANLDAPRHAQVVDGVVRNLAREVEVTAAHVARSCAIANAVEAGIPVPWHTVLGTFPQRPKVFPSVVHGGSRLYLDRDTAQACAALYASAALAVELSQAVVPGLHVLNNLSEHRSPVPAWTRSAMCAHEAVLQAEVFVRNTGSKYPFAANARLQSELLDVAHGAFTGVTPDGAVELPLTHDERRHKRYLRSFAATVVVDEIRVPVMIRDISRGGCGFDTAHRFRPGERITLILDPSTALPGQIAWRSHLSAGIMFDRTISDDDALHLGGAAQR
jgi:hypothetical protein